MLGSLDRYVGIDVGGTKILAGLVGSAGQVSGVRSCSTPGRRVTGVAGAQYCSGKRPGPLRTRETESCGGRPELLTGPMVTAAAEDGDLLARQSFTSVGDWLGVGHRVVPPVVTARFGTRSGLGGAGLLARSSHDVAG